MIDEQKVIALAKEAGERIMGIYSKDFSIYEKSDESPLTEADLLSHNCLVQGLSEIAANIPVLSEESSEQTMVERFGWDVYWLIDPLDGTKEFIKKNGEFTVNIALIESGKAVFGVVHAPAIGVTYWGGKDGAYKEEQEGSVERISVSDTPSSNGSWRIVGSRSHQSEEFAAFVKKFESSEIVSMGSSLKLCLVAEGEAHLYPRLGLTSEWDTAAAQAVVEAAGGLVLKYPDLDPLIYNSHEDTLLNPFFIVCSRLSDVWV